MAVILLRPLECYGDDDSNLRKGRQGSRDSFEFSRAMRPVKRAAAKPPLALVVTSPTEKKADKSDGQRHA